MHCSYIWYVKRLQKKFDENRKGDNYLQKEDVHIVHLYSGTNDYILRQKLVENRIGKLVIALLKHRKFQNSKMLTHKP